MSDAKLKSTKPGKLHRKLKPGESILVGDGVVITAATSADLFVTAPRNVTLKHLGVDEIPDAVQNPPVTPLG